MKPKIDFENWQARKNFDTQIIATYESRFLNKSLSSIPTGCETEQNFSNLTLSQAIKSGYLTFKLRNSYCNLKNTWQNPQFSFKNLFWIIIDHCVFLWKSEKPITLADLYDD